MRIIHENKDLSGQTLVGPGVQAYFNNVNLTDTTFERDWSGTIYFNCNCTRTDWSKADVYASYWREGIYLDAKFPANIGFFHHEPVREILRQRVKEVTIPLSWQQQAQDAVEAVRKLIEDYQDGSWEPAYQVALDAGVTSKQFVTLFRSIFEPYPGLAGRFESLVNEIVLGSKKQERSPTRSSFDFDGQEFTLDASNLPTLSRPQDKYELARWIEQRGKTLTGKDYSIFVHSIVPLRAWKQLNPMDWHHARRGGL